MIETLDSTHSVTLTLPLALCAQLKISLRSFCSIFTVNLLIHNANRHMVDGIFSLSNVAYVKQKHAVPWGYSGLI